MKIYISGPMTGLPDFNKPAFNAAETKLKLKGYTVLSPACLPSSNEITHEEYMVIDLAMLSICDKIYMLDGWKNSTGAKMEYEEAICLGIDVTYEGGNSMDL